MTMGGYFRFGERDVPQALVMWAGDGAGDGHGTLSIDVGRGLRRPLGTPRIRSVVESPSEAAQGFQR